MSFYCFNHDLVAVDLDASWHKQRAFLYGDGHFTTARVEQGRVAYLKAHIARLRHANSVLKINDINWFRLERTLERLALELENGILKVQVSRGEGIRGYGQTLLASPFVFIWLNQAPKWEDIPVDLTLVSTALSHNALLAGLKHTNRLEQILIAQELELLECSDGLVSDIEGVLVETSKANVFWSDGERWFTPDLSLCGINGVMRQQILHKNNAIKMVRARTEDVLQEVKAMVISNSVIGLQKVQSVRSMQLDLSLAQQFIETNL